MKTGMQLTNAQPASSTCSTYHLVAISLPTGRKFTTTSVRVSRRMPAMSAVGAGRLLDHLGEVESQAVVGHAALHGHAELGHLGEAHGVVGGLEDRLAEIAADLAGVDVEGGGELDVADVVAGQPRVHQAGDEGILGRLPVVVHTLDERRCAVSNADDGDSNGSHGGLLSSR